MAYNRPGSFIPEIWASAVLSRLNDALIFAKVVNTDYQGEITAFGDVVKINEIGPITISSHSATSTSGLSPQSLSDAQKLLAINQAESYSFWIDEVDMAQTKPKLMAEGLKEAAWAVANNVDEYIAAMYSQAGLVAGGSISGSTITGVDITSTNVLKYMSIAAQKLDEKNTPELDRWMIVPPWFAHKLALAKVVQDTNNSQALKEGGRGFVGADIYGFTVYKSNNITNGTPAADDACIMFGYRGAISMATQVVKAAIVEPSLHFKTLAKGLIVYGAKVVRPNNLGVLYADYTAEAS